MKASQEEKTSVLRYRESLPAWKKAQKKKKPSKKKPSKKGK